MGNKNVSKELNVNNPIYHLFNENRRDFYWTKRKGSAWYKQMVSVLDGIFTNIKKEREKEFCRINYKNFGNYIMFDSQIWSEDAINNKKNKITFIKNGITTIAEAK